MKLFFLILVLSLSAYAQNSSYSAADQDSSTNTKGPSQMDTGYVNKDAENKDLKSKASMPQKQEETRDHTSGKNATRKMSKTPLDD